MLGNRRETFRNDEQLAPDEFAERAGNRPFDPSEQAMMLTCTDDQELGLPGLHAVGQCIHDISAMGGQVDDFRVDDEVVAIQCCFRARQRIRSIPEQFDARGFEERHGFRSERDERSRIFRNADDVHRCIRWEERFGIRECMGGCGRTVDGYQHSLRSADGLDG